MDEIENSIENYVFKNIDSRNKDFFNNRLSIMEKDYSERKIFYNMYEIGYSFLSNQKQLEYKKLIGLIKNSLISWIAK